MFQSLFSAFVVLLNGQSWEKTCQPWTEGSGIPETIERGYAPSMCCEENQTYSNNPYMP